MGARVGVFYDARDNDWYSEIADENPLPAGSNPDLPPLCMVSLPPFGLPPISDRRATVDPSRDPLTQRPDRDKVSESVMKKYKKVPPEERCYDPPPLPYLDTLACQTR